MSTPVVQSFLTDGYNFENVTRNEALFSLEPKTAKLSQVTKTGTTICGCVYDGGVMLAADCRATAGPVVADKNCFKLHRIADNIFCAGAGTAADCDFVTKEMEMNVEFQSLEMQTQPRVVSVLTQLKRKLFQYQGYIGAYLIVGGVDRTGSHLFTCYAHGSTDKLPYLTMGSGSLAAMSVMETQWKEGLSEEEAKALVTEAIKAGILNDLGSGSNVDVVSVKIDGFNLERSVYSTKREDLKTKPIAVGPPVVISEEVIWEAKEEEVQAAEAMETD